MLRPKRCKEAINNGLELFKLQQYEQVRELRGFSDKACTRTFGVPGDGTAD